MKETLLRNPFDAVETPGVAKRTISRAATRSTPVCSHCQSDDLVAQATVQWSNESQESTGQHLSHAGALQSLQWRLRHHLAVAELSGQLFT